MDIHSQELTEKKSDATHSSKRHLVKAAGVVGLMTLASRILGMIRDIVSAEKFGTSWQWDVFIYAFMLPNFLRRIVGEGALSSAFVPVYSEALEKESQEEAVRYSNKILTLVGTGLLALILGIEVLLTLVMKLGILNERMSFTFDLLRVLFPYLWFISIYAIGMGILNCHRRFLAASLGPVILDLVWIGAVLWIPSFVGTFPEDQIRYLSFWILISGIVQVAAEIPSLIKIGYRPEWIWKALDEKVIKTWRLLLPGIMGFAVVQINLLVDMSLGMAIGPGANSSLWYGTRLMQFPLGIFAIAMGTALLPAISRQTAAKQFEAAKKSLSFALRSVFFIIMPCTVGLIVLRTPIVQLLFERGEFDALSTARTARVLLYYSIGLFAFSGQKMIAAGFFALHDSKTPVKAGVIALLVNIVLNLILMKPMAEAGLALATSLSSVVQFCILIQAYHQRIAGFPFREIASSFLRTLLAALVMGVCCFHLYHFTFHWWSTDATAHQLLRAGVSVGISIPLYFLFCVIFRVREIAEAWRWVKTRG